MSSLDPFHGQRVKDLVNRAKENVELRRFGQGEWGTCLHGVYYRHVFRGSEVVSSAVMEDLNLQARGVLIHRALYWKLNEVERQEWRNRQKGLARMIDKLEMS